MEYMACAKPIVSFDLIESRRSAGDAATYVKQDDPTCLAEAIQELLDNPERRSQMGELGYVRLRTELDWSNSKRNLLNAYAGLLQSN